MRKHTGLEEEMRCPRCASDSTQSVAIAYAQSVRKGSAGYESVSELGIQIARPKQRDEKFWPWFVVVIAATIALIKLPSLLDKLDIESLQGLSSVSWPIVGLACVVGWLAGLCLSVPAIRYNLRVHPGLLAQWQRGMICNRCSHRWQRDLDPSEEESTHGTE